MLGSYWTSVLIFTGVNVLLAWSLWLPIWAGQLVLGQPGFAAVGAYTSAVLTQNGVPFAVALTTGCLAAMVFALICAIPTLRLPPLGTAILTLATAEMARIFLLNFEPVGGNRGLFGIPVETTPGLVAGAILVCLALLSRASRARLGRAWTALREDETAAEAMGINLIRYKLAAFAGSGLLAGLGGGLYAHYLTTLAPDLFGFNLLLQITVYAFLGGRTTHWGPLVGAVLMSLITELFRFLNDWRLLFNGAVLVVVMILRPEGLLSAKTVQRLESALTRRRPKWLGPRSTQATPRGQNDERLETAPKPADG